MLQHGLLMLWPLTVHDTFGYQKIICSRRSVLWLCMLKVYFLSLGFVNLQTYTRPMTFISWCTACLSCGSWWCSMQYGFKNLIKTTAQYYVPILSSPNLINCMEKSAFSWLGAYILQRLIPIKYGLQTDNPLFSILEFFQQYKIEFVMHKCKNY